MLAAGTKFYANRITVPEKLGDMHLFLYSTMRNYRIAFILTQAGRAYGPIPRLVDSVTACWPQNSDRR